MAIVNTDPTCPLCQKETIECGKDKLIFEDSFCYLVENGNTHLIIKDEISFASKRVTFILNEHRETLSQKEDAQANAYLNKIMQTFYGLKRRITA